MKSWIVLVVVIALMAALPLAGNNYLLRLATITCMYAVLAQSWNFIGGMAGYPSFATAAFFGLGAYARRSCSSMACRPSRPGAAPG